MAGTCPSTPGRQTWTSWAKYIVLFIGFKPAILPTKDRPKFLEMFLSWNEDIAWLISAGVMVNLLQTPPRYACRNAWYQCPTSYHGYH